MQRTALRSVQRFGLTEALKASGAAPVSLSIVMSGSFLSGRILQD